MNDLLLWKMLSGQTPIDFRLPNLISQLASEKPDHQWVFYAGLIRIFDRLQPEIFSREEDEYTSKTSHDLQKTIPELREAIHKILQPATGYPLFRFLEKCCSNPDDTNSQSAVEALFKKGTSYRWQTVHAFYSNHPSVRSFAIQHIDDGLTAGLGLHLAEDPTHRDSCLKAIYPQTLTYTKLALIQEFCDRQILTLTQASWLVMQFSYEKWLSKSFSEKATNDRVSLLNSICEWETGELASKTPVPPVIDWLTQVFLGPGSDSAHPYLKIDPTTHWYELFAQFEKSDHQPVDLLIAHLKWMAKNDCYPQALVNLLVRLDLQIATAVWIPEATRRIAVLALNGDPLPKFACNHDLAVKLIKSSFSKTESGQYDLGLVGSLLHHVNSPTKFLENNFSNGKLTAAFWSNPSKSTYFFCSTAVSEKCRLRFLRALCSADKHLSAEVLTLLIERLPASFLSILDHLPVPKLELTFDILLQKMSVDCPKFSFRKMTVLSQIFAVRLKPKFGELLIKFLSVPEYQDLELTRLVLSEITRIVPSSEIVQFAASMFQTQIESFLKMVDASSGISYGFELQLAEKLKSHNSSEVSAWCSQRVLVKKEVSPVKDLSEIPQEQHAELTEAAVQKLVSAPNRSLTKLVQKMKKPVSGLTMALSRRDESQRFSSPEIAAAIAISGDNLQSKLRLFKAFTNDSPDVMMAVESILIRKWKHKKSISLLGHAILWRWEYHMFQFADQIRTAEELLGLLILIDNTESQLGKTSIWCCCVALIRTLLARDPEKANGLVTVEILERVVVELCGSCDEKAAHLIMGLHARPEFREKLEAVKNQAAQDLPSMSAAVREKIEPWISSQGIGKLTTRVRPKKKTCDADLLQQIRSSVNLLELLKLCYHVDSGVVTETVFRLLELGDEGTAVIENSLTSKRVPPRAEVLASTIPLWPAVSSFRVQRLLEFAKNDGGAPFVRFLIGKHVLERDGRFDKTEENHRYALEIIKSAVVSTARKFWFLKEDWEFLIRIGIDKVQFAIAVVTSPQPHAYLAAIDALTTEHPGTDEQVAAVERFLKCGTGRIKVCRLKAALWLQENGNSMGLPLLADNLKQAGASLAGIPANCIENVAESAFVLKDKELEQALLDGIATGWHLKREDRFRLLRKFVSNSNFGTIIEQAVSLTQQSEARERDVSQLARCFHWGKQQAIELLHQPFKISTLSDGQLGYTRLHENKVFVNVLPVLKKMQHGKQIVEGLIIHELGHHLYHKGPKNEAIWAKAERNNIHSLLNLVADEHLERNLRRMNSGYDEKLKRLASHAFQHTQKEMPVQQLLDNLGILAFRVLCRSKLTVARNRENVTIRNGRLLMELGRRGSRFAKFFRALRMGLGNRDNDPKVKEALRLFGKDFRNYKMNQLYKVTRELEKIFSDEPKIYDAISYDGMLVASEDELARHGKSISDAEIENEIRRISSRDQLMPSRKTRSGKSTGRWINVIDEVEFEPISNVVKLSFDRMKWFELSQEVAGPAQKLQRFLQDLGVRYERRPRRLSGHRLDQQAIKRLVTHRDPRIMVSRERKLSNDLFIGVAIDCSASMEHNDNLETAKRFGAMLATAVAAFGRH